MLSKTIICIHCGAEESFSSTIPRHASCTSCHRDLRSCLHCQYFDERLANQCKESQAERVVEKEKANFCGYFVPHGERLNLVGNDSSASKEWEQLFKKSSVKNEAESSSRPTEIDKEFSRFFEKNKEKL